MQNKTVKTTPKNFFASVNIIFLGLLFGLLSFVAIFYFMMESTGFNADFSSPLILVSLVLAALGFFLSGVIYRKTASKIDKNLPLNLKLQKISGAILARYVVVEIPAMLSAIFYMLTGNLFFLAVAAIMILYFVILKPNREKTLEDMNLTPEQKQQMSREDEPI